MSYKMKIHKKLLLIFLVAGTSFSSAKATSTEFSLMQGMMTIAVVILVPIGVGNIIGRDLIRRGLPMRIETKRESKEDIIFIGGMVSGLFTALVLVINPEFLKHVISSQKQEDLPTVIGILAVVSTILGRRVTKNNYSTSTALMYPAWLTDLLKPVESFLQVIGIKIFCKS